ncbi:myeloid differentiation primary response protein MyD88-like [Antedon mediterranea]|uniref:myeloid differentiation primary response protein MyD88-like n=1 Tax=Antedon mediterranea TaxID=105859 RepID=UPI003AF96D1C
MKLLQTFKQILHRRPHRSYSETLVTSDTSDTSVVPQDHTMITSCSCPHLSIKAHTEADTSRSYECSDDSCSNSLKKNINDNIEELEKDYVFLNKPQDDISMNLPAATEACSIDSSIKSFDSLLSSPSSFDSSDNKASYSSECQSDNINQLVCVKPSSLICGSNCTDGESVYLSCVDCEENIQRPAYQRQTSNASSNCDVIEADYEPPVPIPFSEIPAVALSIKTRTQMSLHLNPPLPLGNDWKMLAGELGFEYLETENFNRKDDPTGSVINQWSTKGDSTFKKLLDALKFIERLDVINSVTKYMERDADAWRKKMEREANPFQQTPVSQFAAINYPNLPVTPENRGITLHDHPSGPIETFDAFVCFTIDDRQFVKEMMKHLESHPFNMKLCVAFRDLVPGAAWMTTSAELIGKRCKRMIVVLSPRFTESPECDFQAKFALSLTPGNRCKRIVPIMYESCSIPEILRFISVCDYTKTDLRPFFWERLAVALGLN